MKASELAALSGVTVRTLHHYDSIGLLPPSRVTDAGYRYYDQSAVERLQQILFFRELDFPLGEIKAILQNPAFDRGQALQQHRALLLQKRDRLDKLVGLVDRTIKGEEPMSFKEFDMTEIEAARQQYGEEARERWGGTDAYAESKRRTDSYTPADWERVQGESNDILQAFAACRHLPPDSAEAVALVQRWQQHITDSYYPCTDAILAGLGQMYTADPRFSQNLDSHGKGTAAYMAQAIASYCSSQEDV